MSWPRWFRIVSTRIAVLPVVRSPMISSRWPRPIGIIESIALIPVCTGSFTGWRWITPGALNSSGRRSLASMAPWPSIGLPSGSTMRPISSCPTGTLATRPGALDRLPFLDVLPFAEERDADVVLLEVEREPGDPVLELEQLQRHAVLEPVDAGDPVADLKHGADLGQVGLHVVLLDPLLEDRGDLFGAKLHSDSLGSKGVTSGAAWSSCGRLRCRTGPTRARTRRRCRSGACATARARSSAARSRGVAAR